MALPENQYIVLSDATVGEKHGGRPFEILRRWLVQCPQCSEVRLVVGARENDHYVCKDCGHSFTITNDELAKESREDEERLGGTYR
jgi:DNA-directed RNA polymerase subunit RPC12/RpoP